jgi:cell division protein FtsB
MSYRQRLEAAERKLAAREGRPGLTANVEALKAEIKKLKPKVRKQARQEAQSV